MQERKRLWGLWEYMAFYGASMAAQSKQDTHKDLINAQKGINISMIGALCLIRALVVATQSGQQNTHRIKRGRLI